MRNLLEYPVTRQELLLFLGQLRSEHDPHITGACGDMSPILLDHITKIVQAAFELRDGFDRRCKEPGMGFVVPFPEATKLILAVDFVLGDVGTYEGIRIKRDPA